LTAYNESTYSSSKGIIYANPHPLRRTAGFFNRCLCRGRIHAAIRQPVQRRRLHAKPAFERALRLRLFGRQCFARAVVLLKLVGIHPVIVHGGGPQINEMLEKIGKKGEFVQGMRVTDGETMDIVEMVLGGHVNKEIVSLINLQGGRAVGVTGRDNHFIKAKKLLVDTPERAGVDIGQVGTVESIDVRLIEGLIERGCIPVVAPIGVGAKGEAFNINADLVAGKLAEELNAEKLLMMTNIPGVLDKEGRLLTTLTPSRIDELIEDGTLYGGMLPKIASAVEAAKSGVKATHIIYKD